MKERKAIDAHTPVKLFSVKFKILCRYETVRDVVRKKNGIMWGKFPKGGEGSDPNPLVDVYLPSYFWHAKMILRC